MTCPDCRIPVERDAKFCPKCYARIEPPNLLRRLVDFFKNLVKPGVHVLKSNKTVTITTVDRNGTRQEYLSINELPMALRSQFEKMEFQAMEDQDQLSSELLAQPAPPGITRKTVSIYKVKDASGQERTCHSLDELPPKIREALKRLQTPPDASS